MEHHSSWVPLDTQSLPNIPTFCLSCDLPLASFLQKWKWLQRFCCLVKVTKLSLVLPFIPREVRNERGIWGARYPALAPPASTPGLLLSTEEGLQYSPLTILSKWPSSREGKAAVSDFLHTQGSTLNPSSSKRRHELQCAECASPCPSFVMGRIATWELTRALPGQVLKGSSSYLFPTCLLYAGHCVMQFLKLLYELGLWGHWGSQKLKQ